MRQPFKITVPPAILAEGILNDAQQWMGVLIPEAGENRIKNPSFERGITNWTATANGSPGTILARSTAYQIAGAYSGTLTIQSGGTYAQILDSGSVVAGTATALSCFVRIPGGGEVTRAKLQFVIGSTLFNYSKAEYISGGWWRCIFLNTPSVSGSPGIRVFGTPGQVFYVDGFQWENSAYETEYFDGDSVGLSLAEFPPAFTWTGTPHGSSSLRSAATRAGGRLAWFDEFNLSILSMQGFHAPVVENAATPSGSGVGAIYQSSSIESRQVAVTARFDAVTPQQLQRVRGAFIDAVTVARTSRDQPVTLVLQSFIEDRAISARTTLVASYSGGLEGEYSNLWSEGVSIKFTAWEPWFFATQSQAVAITDQALVTPAYAFIYNLATGALTALTSFNGAIGVSNEDQQCVIRGPDGLFYFGGSFTAPGTRVVSYDPGSGTFTGLGALTQNVRALLFGPDGTLYAGLEAAVTIGPNTCSVVSWNGSAWACVGTGTTGRVRTLAYDPTRSRLYVAGDIAGVNILSRYWNGSAWTSVTIANTTTVYGSYYDLTLDRVFFAGSNAGGTGTGVVQYDGSTTSVMTGASGAFNIAAYSVAGDGAGTVYFAGYSSENAKWNGLEWVEDFFPSTAGSVLTSLLFYDREFDRLITTGMIPETPVLNLGEGCGLFLYAEETVRLPIATFFTANARPYVISPQYAVVGTAVSSSFGVGALITASNQGRAIVYPTIVLTNTDAGNGTKPLYQIANYTTGKAIVFDGLQVQYNETITIKCDPRRVRVISDKRGDLTATGVIASGSDIAEMHLVPGSNAIHVLAFNTLLLNGYMYWTPRYKTLDDLVSK